jgi:hypothetical protein
MFYCQNRGDTKDKRASINIIFTETRDKDQKKALITARKMRLRCFFVACQPMIFSQRPNWYYGLHIKTIGAIARQAI